MLMARRVRACMGMEIARERHELAVTRTVMASPMILPAGGNLQLTSLPIA